LEPLGDLTGLYSPKYDPFSDEPKSYFSNSDVTTGIFSDSNDLSGKDRELLEPLKKFALDGSKAWIFNPHLYNVQASSRNGVSTVLEHMCLRRRQRSPLKHPDGRVTYFARDMPTVGFRHEELRFGPDMAEMVKTHGQEMAAKLVMQATTGDIADYTPTKTTGTSENKAEIQINFAAVREGALAALDFRNLELFQKAQTRLGKNLAEGEQLIEALNNKDKTTTQAKRQVPSNEPVVGVRHIAGIVVDDRSNGLGWLYQQLR
jgi:hypothetical protein